MLSNATLLLLSTTEKSVSHFYFPKSRFLFNQGLLNRGFTVVTEIFFYILLLKLLQYYSARVEARTFVPRGSMVKRRSPASRRACSCWVGSTALKLWPPQGVPMLGQRLTSPKGQASARTTTGSRAGTCHPSMPETNY